MEGFGRLIAVVAAIGALAVIYYWAKELRFYHLNSWDFSKPSNIIPDMWVRAGSYRYVLPNRLRIFLGYPFLLLFAAFVLVAALNTAGAFGPL